MDQGQFEAKLADTELRLKRLRQLYDQWFHGIERAEPQNQRLEVDRQIAALRREQIRNTALRFRLNQLVQRYLTYNTYWQRVTRQIEEGTYKRDVIRARKRFGPARPEGAEAEPNRPDAYELDLEIDVEDALEQAEAVQPPASARGSSWPAPAGLRGRAAREITPFALPRDDAQQTSSDPEALRAPSGPLRVPSGPLRAPSGPLRAPSGPLIVSPSLPAGAAGSLRPRGAPPPVPQASRRPPPASPGRAAHAPAAGNGISDEQILNLYQRYVSARRDNKERTDNVRIETVAKTVRDMMPKLKEKHGGKQIDFEVVVKDGRVALKPVAK